MQHNEQLGAEAPGEAPACASGSALLGAVPMATPGRATPVDRAKGATGPEGAPARAAASPHYRSGAARPCHRGLGAVLNELSGAVGGGGGWNLRPALFSAGLSLATGAGNGPEPAVLGPRGACRGMGPSAFRGPNSCCPFSPCLQPTRHPVKAAWLSTPWPGFPKDGPWLAGSCPAVDGGPSKHRCSQRQRPRRPPDASLPCHMTSGKALTHPLPQFPP